MANDVRSATGDPLRAGSRRLPPRDQPVARGPGDRLRALIAGGTDGNERLTVQIGLVLIVLLAVLGVTIVRIGQLLWLHLFLGLVLLGPVALKLLSTGYRFVRYYTANPAYRRKGPPALLLRLLGPLVVLTTVAVFATGVALLALGPGSRNPWVLVHKVSFIAWLAFTAVHVLGHLPEIARYGGDAARRRREMIALGSPSARRAVRLSSDRLGGAAGRGLSLAISLASGLALAIALVGTFAAWTH